MKDHKEEEKLSVCNHDIGHLGMCKKCYIIKDKELWDAEAPKAMEAFGEIMRRHKDKISDPQQSLIEKEGK